MKTLMILLVIAIPVFSFSHDKDPVILQTYSKKSGKKVLHVFRIISDQRYEYFKFKDSVMQYDWGFYIQKGKKITLSTAYNKAPFNYLEGKELKVTAKSVSYDGHKNYLSADDSKTLQFPFGRNPINGEPVAQQSKIRLDLVEPNYTLVARNFYLKMVDKYVPRYNEVLNKAYCGPGHYITFIDGVRTEWNKDTSYRALMPSIGTVIHESIHGYNEYLDSVYRADNKIDSTIETSSYYIKPGLTFNMEMGLYIKSELVVPKDDSLETYRIFRFDTYMSEGSYVYSNQYGIYGLMEEYVAYKNTMEFLLITYEKARKQADKRSMTYLKDQMKRTYNAYFEFNLFIGWYLQYTKKERFDVYKSTMQNVELRTAYTLAEMDYQRVLKKWHHLLQGHQWVMRGGEYAKSLLPSVQQELDLFKIERLDPTKYDMVVIR
jgi:hypothetical protein